MKLKDIHTPTQLENHITSLRRKIRTLRRKGNQSELENALIDLDIALDTREGFADLRRTLNTLKKAQ